MKDSLYEVMGVFFFTYQIIYLFIIILNLIFHLRWKSWTYRKWLINCKLIDTSH
jgi:hypothetical protein